LWFDEFKYTMKQRSPTLEGFRVMFSRPSLGLAEVAWRWAFGFAAISLLAISVLQYLGTLPVSAGDLFLLQTRHPLLISHAIAHIFQGSAFRAIKVAVLLSVLLSAAWTVIASWSRVMTIRALIEYFGQDKSEGGQRSAADSARNFQHGSPLGINVLRVVMTAAAVLGCFGAFVLGHAASPSSNPSPGSAALIVLTLIICISVAWSFLNWILSLAAILAVADGKGTHGAISGAVELCRIRWGSLMAASTWFGLAHLAVFIIASSIVMFPLAFAGVLPPGMVLGGVLLVSLLYFAAVDFLYAGRMAAYVAMIEFPVALLAPLPPPSHLVNTDPPTRQLAPHTGIDRNELILSDVPILR
jgi:hypothetical protein